MFKKIAVLRKIERFSYLVQRFRVGNPEWEKLWSLTWTTTSPLFPLSEWPSVALIIPDSTHHGKISNQLFYSVTWQSNFDILLAHLLVKNLVNMSLLICQPNRLYSSLTSRTIIRIVGDVQAEKIIPSGAFLALLRHLYSQVISIPDIFAIRCKRSLSSNKSFAHSKDLARSLFSLFASCWALGTINESVTKAASIAFLRFFSESMWFRFFWVSLRGVFFDFGPGEFEGDLEGVLTIGVKLLWDFLGIFLTRLCLGF